jgi:uncharacterized membrane protein
VSLAVAASDITATPLGLRAVISSLLVVIGLALAVVGWYGWREALPRNRFAGVRTTATLHSDEAFRIANKVAGLPILLAGAVLTVCGLLATTLVGVATLVTVVVVALCGSCALAVAGGVLGHRAALTLPDPPAADSSGCGGICAGCTLSCHA